MGITMWGPSPPPQFRCMGRVRYSVGRMEARNEVYINLNSEKAGQHDPIWLARPPIGGNGVARSPGRDGEAGDPGGTSLQSARVLVSAGDLAPDLVDPNELRT